MFDVKTARRFRSEPFLFYNTLTKSNVLDYFYMSPFFEPTADCINQKRRRGVTVPPDADGVEYKVIANCDAAANTLSAAIGAVWNHPNQFGTFVIQKVKRVGGRETPLGVYYCIGGTIFAAPTTSCLVRRRIQVAALKVSSLLDRLESMLTWSALTGHGWCSAQVPKGSEMTSCTVDSVTGSTVRTFDTFVLRPLTRIDDVLEAHWADVVADVNHFIKESEEIKASAAEACIAHPTRPEVLNMIRQRLKLQAGIVGEQETTADEAEVAVEVAVSPLAVETKEGA